MIAFIKNIRKIMGWCPNVRAVKSRKSVQFDDLTVNAPDTGAGSTYTPSWWKKYHNLVLLVSICLTLLSIKWFISPEINYLDFLMAVIFTAIFFVVLVRLPEFYSLDKIAKSKSENTIKLSTKRMLALYILNIFMLIAFSYLWSVYGWGRIPGYFFGFLLVSWVWYLQILYWEKKNRKVIVTHGYFKPTVVIINPGSK